MMDDYKAGKHYNTTIEQIRDVAASIGKPASLVSRWVNEARRKELGAWYNESIKWLNSHQHGESYEAFIARMPKGVKSGNEWLDNVYEAAFTSAVKLYQSRWETVASLKDCGLMPQVYDTKGAVVNG